MTAAYLHSAEAMGARLSGAAIVAAPVTPARSKRL
jgi:hypothetical protein